MAAETNEQTLYRVEYRESVFYVTADNAFAAFARCAEHDVDQRSFAHEKQAFAADVDVRAVGTTDEDVFAWGVTE